MMEDARTVEAELVEVWVDDPDVLTVDAVVVDEAEDARHMTAEEALAQAAREGLVLVRSRSNKTGYFGVQFDNRARQLKRPYSVRLEGVSSIHTKVRPTCLGTFATAEQAALVYARRTGNRAERIVAGKGRAEGTLKAMREAAGYTVVCRRCQALVPLVSARRHKRAGAPFAKGDGCYRCSSNSRPGRLRKRQMDMVQAVQLGKRTLVAWPKTNERRVAVQALPPDEAAAAVRAALDALVPEESRILKSAPRASTSRTQNSASRAPTLSAQGLEETPVRRSQRSGKARALWLEVEEPASEEEEDYEVEPPSDDGEYIDDEEL